MALASGIADSHPGDLCARLFYVDALIHKRDAKALSEEIERDRASYRESLVLRPMFTRTEATLAAWDLTARGRNGADVAARIFDPKTDMTGRLASLPRLMECEGFAVPSVSLFVESAPMKFLDVQITVKVFRVLAVFRMLEGRRAEALAILGNSYRLGQYLIRRAAR
jgi:hypothetical protein